MVAQQAPQGKPFPLLAREGRLGASVAKAGPHSHPDGRISSINRLFAASNGLTNLTPANSKPSCRSSVTRWRTPARCAVAHNIASQNANRCFFTASSAAERSSSSVPCTGSTARHASIVVRTSSTPIPALRIATLLRVRGDRAPGVFLREEPNGWRRRGCWYQS